MIHISGDILIFFYLLSALFFYLVFAVYLKFGLLFFYEIQFDLEKNKMEIISIKDLPMKSRIFKELGFALKWPKTMFRLLAMKATTQTGLKNGWLEKKHN